MYSEERKTHLIEELSKVDNEAVLIELESVLKNYYKKSENKSDILGFVGVISQKDADVMRRAVTEVCETINIDDWK